MRSTIIIAVAAAMGVSFVAAQDYGDVDYPSACQSVCSPVVSQASACDDQNDEDSAELSCLCTGPNMSNLIPQCRDCMVLNKNDDDDEIEEMDELLRACNIPSTTGTNSSTAPQTTALTSSAPTATDGSVDSDGEDDGENENSSSSSSTTENMAVSTAAPLLGAGVGLMLAALAAW